jgi:nucleoside-diphosphate-sugar epimerase
MVTGAAGFIGRALCRGLVERGHRVRGPTRGQALAIEIVVHMSRGVITEWAKSVQQ